MKERLFRFWSWVDSQADKAYEELAMLYTSRSAFASSYWETYHLFMDLILQKLEVDFPELKEELDEWRESHKEDGEDWEWTNK